MIYHDGRLTAEQQAMADELAKWWRETAEEEISQTVEKAIEYSASDLVDIGRGLLGGNRTDEEYTEAGIAFYALGKVSRIMGAIREGRRPSYDSWLDLGVYARMAQRTRETGGWPGTQPTTGEDNDRRIESQTISLDRVDAGRLEG